MHPLLGELNDEELVLVEFISRFLMQLLDIYILDMDGDGDDDNHIQSGKVSLSCALIKAGADACSSIDALVVNFESGIQAYGPNFYLKMLGGDMGCLDTEICAKPRFLSRPMQHAFQKRGLRVSRLWGDRDTSQIDSLAEDLAERIRKFRERRKWKGKRA